jgi:hypothetical protein
VSDLIRDCVFRVLGGVDSDRIMDKLIDIQNGLDLKNIQAEILSLRAAIGESMSIIDGKRSELLRIARETSNPADNSNVIDYLVVHGRSTLDEIVAGTSIEKADVYKALQILCELGNVIMNANKHPTTWEMRK